MSPFAQWLLGLFGGLLGGAFGTLIAFRTTLYAMKRDIADQKVALTKVQDRQFAVLRLTADIARKVGVDGRVFDDALVRMLTSDAE